MTSDATGLAIVLGVEMHPTQRKIAYQCDRCGATFGGGYKWNEAARLKSDAIAAGWSIGATDLCPAHVSETADR